MCRDKLFNLYLPYENFIDNETITSCISNEIFDTEENSALRVHQRHRAWGSIPLTSTNNRKLLSFSLSKGTSVVCRTPDVSPMMKWGVGVRSLYVRCSFRSLPIAWTKTTRDISVVSSSTLPK